MPKNHGLFIGINDYKGTQNDLFGCVNDANDWHALIAPTCSTTSLLLNGQASRAGILNGISNLLRKLGRGDTGIITYSGHGTWIPDRNGDEADRRDEALVGADLQLILDDELFTILSKRTAGTNIFFVTDSCNSGTVYRMFNPFPESQFAPRVRFLPPEKLPLAEADHARAARVASTRLRIKPPTIVANTVHYAGCLETQYSYDAVFNNRPSGAFTYCAMKALKSLPKRTTTYRTWFAAIQRMLPTAQYPQTPVMNAGVAESNWTMPWW